MLDWPEAPRAHLVAGLSPLTIYIELVISTYTYVTGMSLATRRDLQASLNDTFDQNVD